MFFKKETNNASLLAALESASIDNVRKGGNPHLDRCGVDRLTPGIDQNIQF